MEEASQNLTSVDRPQVLQLCVSLILRILAQAFAREWPSRLQLILLLVNRVQGQLKVRNTNQIRVLDCFLLEGVAIEVEYLIHLREPWWIKIFHQGYQLPQVISLSKEISKITTINIRISQNLRIKTSSKKCNIFMRL